MSLCISFFFGENIHVRKLASLPAPLSHTENNVFSLWSYNNKDCKNMIRFMKTHRSYLLSKHIGRYAALHIYDHLGEQQSLSYFKEPLIIPIPISSQRLRNRGFNQNHLWGYFLHKHIEQSTYDKKILIKSKATKKQALIKKRQERFLNVKGVFEVPAKKRIHIKNKDIILIDDLTTTGATLQEAASTLKTAGARNIILLSLAH